MNFRLAAILTAIVALPSAAYAQVGRPCQIINGASSATCASEATLVSLQTYLETGRSSSLYANTSGGLISQMAALNKQISALRKQAQNDLGNQDVRNRALAAERAILESFEEVTRPISARECRSSAVAAGAFGGGGGGGGGATANTTEETEKAAKELEPEVLTPASENDYVARLINAPKSLNYCTQEDHENKVPVRGGGICPGPGSLPGANNNPSSLIRGATTDPAKKPGNFSIKSGTQNDQYAAAIDYIRYSMPFPAPAIRDSYKDQPAAKRFLILQRRYNGRSMAVVYGLASILGESVALPSGHPFVANVWNSKTIGEDLRRDYEEINPNIDLPSTPSERELMHLLVKRQFAKTLLAQDLSGNDVEYFARRSLEVDKINAYLALKLNEKSEWSNIMLAHILSNDIDPVDRKQLFSDSAAVQ